MRKVPTAKRQYAQEFYKSNDAHMGACPVCNLYYAEDVLEDCKYHRTFHRRVVDVFEPKPSVSIARLFGKHGQFIPVHRESASHLRRRLANISRVFKKEFGCDFTMYDEAGDPGEGYLISDADGRALGGSTIRWIEYSNAPAQWVWSWIWIVPTHRRHRLMQAFWDMVRDKYPGIDPDPPFSRSAASFFANREDVSGRIRAYAKKQLATSNFD
jgi:zinc-finger of acetyl-transferase ESCO